MEIKPSPIVTGFIALSQLIILTLATMITVSGGSFNFGSIPYKTVKGAPVTLTYDYSIGQFEVTNEEYIAFLNDAEVLPDGSFNGTEWIDMDDEDCEIGFSGTHFVLNTGSEKAPVIEVTWFGAAAFCNWLSLKESLNPAYDSNGNLLDMEGKITSDITKVEGYRLPTEAEWEFAARGGNKSNGFMYAGSNKIEKVGWYRYNADWTHDVGELSGNELSIHDMSGNVSEWCHDWFAEDYFETPQAHNPVNLTTSSLRVVRGGNWFQDQSYCRVTHRTANDPIDSHYTIGFRVAKTEFK